MRSSGSDAASGAESSADKQTNHWSSKSKSSLLCTVSVAREGSGKIRDVILCPSGAPIYGRLEKLVIYSFTFRFHFPLSVIITLFTLHHVDD